MSSLFGGPQFAYLLVALAVLGLAFAGIVWVGKTIRGELGTGNSRSREPAGPGALERVPPPVMKEAIARGLVVPAQLAAMSETERAFLFASLEQKLAAGAPAEAPAHAAPAPAPAPAHQPAASRPPADVPAAMRAILEKEKLRAWCAMCGTELELPAFPPLIARCASCGMRSAIRPEEGGRYVVNLSPPPKPG